MKWMQYALMAIMSVTNSACIQGGAIVEDYPVKIENGITSSQLAYYSESFDKLRSDLWDKSGFAFEETQLENIKLADMSIEDGKLILRTKIGAYSKAGLGSRYALRGDFDIQIDCQIDFYQEMSGMDQLVHFLVIDKTMDYESMNLVTINLVKRGEAFKSYIVTAFRKQGNYKNFNYEEIKQFHGSLRITRLGSRVSTFYREGSEEKWKRLGTTSFNTNDVLVSLGATNFVAAREKIDASKSITVTFDNFRINAAQEIVEDEI